MTDVTYQYNTTQNEKSTEEGEIFDPSILVDILNGVTGTPISLTIIANIGVTEIVQKAAYFTVNIIVNNIIPVSDPWVGGILLSFIDSDGKNISNAASTGTMGSVFVPFPSASSTSQISNPIAADMTPGSVILLAKPAIFNTSTFDMRVGGAADSRLNRRFRIANLTIIP